MSIPVDGNDGDLSLGIDALEVAVRGGQARDEAAGILEELARLRAALLTHIAGPDRRFGRFVGQRGGTA